MNPALRETVKEDPVIVFEVMMLVFVSLMVLGAFCLGTTAKAADERVRRWSEDARDVRRASRGRRILIAPPR